VSEGVKETNQRVKRGNVVKDVRERSDTPAGTSRWQHCSTEEFSVFLTPSFFI